MYRRYPVKPLTMKHLLPYLLLLLGIGHAHAQLPAYVVDKGDFLSSEEQEELKTVLRDYQRHEGVQFYLYTVASLGGTTISQAANLTAQRIGLNMHGTNNTALIFLSKKEQKIYIAVGWGLEWSLTDEVTKIIKREVIGQFKYGNFYEGIKLGFTRMLEYAKDQRWQVSFNNAEELGNSKAFTVGAIALLQCQVVSTKFREERIADAQYSDKYFIYVKTGGGAITKLHFSRQAFADIQKLLQAGKGRVYGRIKVANPLDLNFLGLDPDDPAYE